MINAHMPDLLRPGDTAAVLAASGPCDSERLVRGVGVLKSMGLVPWVMESCHRQHGYLAGADDLRLRDLHIAFAAPEVRGIFVARGGYGAQRLLPGLDYGLIRDNPKVFVGYSDVTALHVVLNQRCGLITFHGPMPGADLGRDTAPFTMQALKRMIFAEEERHGDGSSVAALKRLQQGTAGDRGVVSMSRLANPLIKPLTTIVPGCATGRLTGGNLSLLAASIGTPYEVDTRGCILFLEETEEAPYRIDRMLLQLKLAGKLRDATGIILGNFSPQTLETLHISIRELIITEGKPTLAGLICGHTSPTLTLSMGRQVALDATAKEIKLL